MDWSRVYFPFIIFFLFFKINLSTNLSFTDLTCRFQLNNWQAVRMLLAKLTGNYKRVRSNILMGVHQTFGESQTHQIPIFASISPLDFFRRFFTQKAMKWCCVFSSFSNGLITSWENFSPFMVCWHFRALLPTLKNLFVLKKGQKWFEFEIPSLIVISSPC